MIYDLQSAVFLLSVGQLPRRGHLYWAKSQSTIVELESIGFLVADKQRFQKIPGRRGEWDIVFSLAGHPPRRKSRPSVGTTSIHSMKTRTKRPDKLDRYLESLPNAKRLEIESQAMQHASGFLLETLESHKDGPLADEFRNQILKVFLTNVIGKGSA